ncbi:hypothetical protein, partial [uncultured Acetobacterium sp.]|uniref:hypothetical protein n=1 Tax=uncultured Acetobacterium sp. TaxID=217139 RepID=UPI0025ED757F
QVEVEDFVDVDQRESERLVAQHHHQGEQVVKPVRSRSKQQINNWSVRHNVDTEIFCRLSVKYR